MTVSLIKRPLTAVPLIGNPLAWLVGSLLSQNRLMAAPSPAFQNPPSAAAHPRSLRCPSAGFALGIATAFIQGVRAEGDLLFLPLFVDCLLAVIALFVGDALADFIQIHLAVGDTQQQLKEQRVIAAALFQSDIAAVPEYARYPSAS